MEQAYDCFSVEWNCGCCVSSCMYLYNQHDVLAGATVDVSDCNHLRQYVCIETE